MRIQQANNFTTPQLIRTQNQPPAPETPPTPGGGDPQPPQEKVSIGKEGLRTAIAWGNATGTVTGGATALATTIGGLYMGVLGGAIVGGVLGGGLGPVFGAISGGGAMGFIGTSFKTLGIAAKAGVVLGGAAGAAGTWSVGQKLGEVAGKTVAFGPGFVAGAIGAVGKKAEEVATGEPGGDVQEPSAPKPKPKPKKNDLNQMSGIGKTVAAGVGGFGMLAGGAGGFVAGAGIASTGSLINGLLAHNVTLSNITGAALAGGITGGIAMGLMGAVGGWKLVKLGESVINKGKDIAGKE